MSRKSRCSFVIVAVAFIFLSLSTLACSFDNPCTDCKTDSESGKQVTFNKETKTWVEPTPTIKQTVNNIAKDTELSLSSSKEIDRIGLGNTNARINAWTEECMAKGGTTRTLDVATLICEKK